MTLRKTSGSFKPIEKIRGSFWEALRNPEEHIVVVGYRFHTGKWSTKGYLDLEEYNKLLKDQMTMPQIVMESEEDGKRWWMFEGEFYWEDEGLTALEIKALILERRRKRKEQIHKAMLKLGIKQDQIEDK